MTDIYYSLKFQERTDAAGRIMQPTEKIILSYGKKEWFHLHIPEYKMIDENEICWKSLFTMKNKIPCYVILLMRILCFLTENMDKLFFLLIPKRKVFCRLSETEIFMAGWKSGEFTLPEVQFIVCGSGYWLNIPTIQRKIFPSRL